MAPSLGGEVHHGLKRAAATSNLLRKEPARDRGESKLVLREGGDVAVHRGS